MPRYKHPRLPNGYGSISKLSGKRRNPYCVRPPTTEYDDEGRPIRPKPICYTDTWHHAFVALTAWKAGTYTPGMEATLSTSEKDIERILADYSRVTRKVDGLTFKQVYDLAIEHHKVKNLTESATRNYKNGFNALAALHDQVLSALTLDDLQNAVNQVQGKALPSFAKRTLRLCYKYAVLRGFCKTNLGSYVIVSSYDEKHGTPFSDDEIKTLWEHYKEDKILSDALIMIYSGFRVSAYNTIEVNLKERYFKGGVKTKAGKGRIVPIHECIYPLVKKYGVPVYNGSTYGSRFSRILKTYGMDHSPHDCRHTFSALCERYGVRENDRKRLLGHAFTDVTNGVYGHRTLEDLTKEISKICCPIVVHGT